MNFNAFSPESGLEQIFNNPDLKMIYIKNSKTANIEKSKTTENPKNQVIAIEKFENNISETKKVDSIIENRISEFRLSNLRESGLSTG